jgi:uncharacterized protein YjaG (DUF416 family)
MEIIRFSNRWLIGKLEKMPPIFRTLFAAAAAERLSQAYLRYAHLTGRGNPEVLAEALNRLWSDIEGQRANSERPEETLQRVMALIPKEDNGPWVPEQAWAEDATAAVAYALQCLESGRSAESAWVAQRAYEAVDHFVVTENAIHTSKPGASARILSSSLVQAELRRQRRDIDELLAENTDVQNLAALAARMRQRAQIDSRTMFAENS